MYKYICIYLLRVWYKNLPGKICNFKNVIPLPTG